MKKSSLGYTLIEMMVAVTIAVVLSLSLAKLNLAGIISFHKTGIFTNRIIGAIEITRNNFMSGKFIDSAQTSGYAWKVDFPINTSNTYIYVRYKQTSASAWVESVKQRSKIEDFEKIDSIACKKLDGTTNTVSTTGSFVGIVFEPGKVWFEGCPDATYRTIEITSSFKGTTKKIVFNGMSGIVESVQ